jgi:hypothetical protein
MALPVGGGAASGGALPAQIWALWAPSRSGRAALSLLTMLPGGAEVGQQGGEVAALLASQLDQVGGDLAG